MVLIKVDVMIKIKNRNQLILPGFETWRNEYSVKKLKLLEESWAGVFREDILPKLDSEEIVKLYSSGMGRPTKELHSIIGATVLQQIFNLTDEETISELAFNQQWHFALECFSEEDQIISDKTLWTMRKQIVSLDLANNYFRLITDDFIKKYNVDTGSQRLDSVHVHSNMARVGRIRILGKTIIKFLKNLKRQNVELFEADISLTMKEKYLTKAENSYFGKIKPSETEQSLQLLSEDIYCLKLQFQNNKKVSAMTSFKLLERVFREHCSVDDEHVTVKPSKQVPSDSVQNPSDPDAGYDGHKGQGYQTQLMETYSTEEEKESTNEHKLNLITYVETESADKHDSNALQPAIDGVKEREIDCGKVLADTAYGGNKNIQEAGGKDVLVIAPIAGKPSKKRLELFKFDPISLEIIACPKDKLPDKIKENKKSSITALWHKRTCRDCAFNGQCPTKICKNGRKINYTKDSVRACLRRINEASDEFREDYRYRSGIEATNSRFIHMTGARRSRYRGLKKMKFGQTLKALAINMFRVVKYRKKKNRFADLLNIIAYFNYLSPIYDKNSYNMMFALK